MNFTPNSTGAPHIRLRLFDALPEPWQREAWDALSLEIARAAGR
jgi:hypothetical protein